MMEDFLDGWRNAYGDERAEVAVDKMIEFALQDVAAGRLSMEDTRMVFDLPEADNKKQNDTSAENLSYFIATEQISVSDVPDKLGGPQTERLKTQLASLGAQDKKPLFRRLWIPQSEEDIAFEPRYEFIRKWLQTPVRGSRDRRLMCLMRFLDVHKEWASDATFRKLAIRDCENLLSLWKTFPRMLKEFSSSSQWSWHAVIAWNYWTLFLTGGQWTLFDNFGLLIEINKHCDLAIDGYRKTNQITSVANMEKLSAQIGILTLRRINIYRTLSTQETRSEFEDRVLQMTRELFGELPEIESKIPELKAEGLRLLTESDEIHSRTEREASWEDGLEGIQKRLELSKLQTNHATTRFAMRFWV